MHRDSFVWGIKYRLSYEKTWKNFSSDDFVMLQNWMKAGKQLILIFMKIYLWSKMCFTQPLVCIPNWYTQLRQGKFVACRIYISSNTHNTYVIIFLSVFSSFFLKKKKHFCRIVRKLGCCVNRQLSIYI